MTVATSPPGLSFSVSGAICAPGSYIAPMNLQWTPGSSCTVTVTSPQGADGLLSWDDGSTNAARSITAPSTATTYTATFGTAPVITTNPSSMGVTGVPAMCLELKIYYSGCHTAGSTATFTAAATGNPTPTVQWQVSTDGGATFTNCRPARPQLR